MKILIVLQAVFVVCLGAVENCYPEKCLIKNNCKCSSKEGPINTDDIPQLVMISFSDTPTRMIYDQVWEPIFFDRKNPDNCPIGMTFFISHNNTNYAVVNQLYNKGYEISSYSITNSSSRIYWLNASKEIIIDEIGGQKRIISKFANIPMNDIKGGRIPLLAINYHTFPGLKDAGFEYDNSWYTQNLKSFFPHTLEYKSEISCLGICQKESLPGFWELPIIDWVDMNNMDCNSLEKCKISGSEDGIFSWMKNEFEKIYEGNRAPFSIPLKMNFFEDENKLNGFKKFLDYLSDLNDVFIVNEGVVVEWMKNPVSNDEFKSCGSIKPKANCDKVTCLLKHGNEMRVMVSCVACPNNYPWLGNPLGN